MPDVHKVTETGQTTLEDYNPEYAAFVEKFKPKKTTDDCYTPPNVYDAISAWVAQEYGLNPADFVRPFWPGGDYERFKYPEGCIVVDNPPFSIETKIIRFYLARGIRFFLFAPTLTLFSLLNTNDICAVPCACNVTYENGAIIRTSFVTNLETELRVRTAPDLFRAVEDADAANKVSKTLPSYQYPPEVITAALVSKWAKWGVDFRVPKKCCTVLHGLEEQKRQGKSIYGYGLLLSRKLAAEATEAARAAERAKAEEVTKTMERRTWQLSPLEQEIVRRLSKEDET